MYAILSHGGRQYRVSAGDRLVVDRLDAEVGSVVALEPVLLTGSYLVAGALQPASYSPVRKTISVMAGQAGTDRWIMTGGIFLVGGCYLVTAAGLTGVRAAARVLLIVAGLAGIGIAASPVPASGATPRHLAWTMLGAA